MAESFQTSPFAFAVCQPGSERWLKAELAHSRPDLHPSWMRPGLLTLKATGQPFGPDETPPAVFARAWGAAAGPVADLQAVVEIADRVGARRLFVGHRDQGPPGDVPPTRERAAEEHAANIEAELRARRAFDDGPLEDGEVVLDVVTSPGEPSLVGWHNHGICRHQHPCGRFPVVVPEGAPSRAYRKMVEGLLWSRAPLAPGERVLEIGAAPGGGTLALVERGLRVLAVDPNPLDERVSKLAAVTFVRRPVGELRREELPRDVAWLTCDANIAPAHTLRAVQRLMPVLKRGLKGLLLTLKLNDEAVVADLPRLLTRVEALGASEVKATQLPSNGREVFVYGVMRG